MQKLKQEFAQKASEMARLTQENTEMEQRIISLEESHKLDFVLKFGSTFYVFCSHTLGSNIPLSISLQVFRSNNYEANGRIKRNSRKRKS